jgi:hypothetical protein
VANSYVNRAKSNKFSLIISRCIDSIRFFFNGLLTKLLIARVEDTFNCKTENGELRIRLRKNYNGNIFLLNTELLIARVEDTFNCKTENGELRIRRIKRKITMVIFFIKQCYNIMLKMFTILHKRALRLTPLM